MAQKAGGEQFCVIAHRGWSGAYPENSLVAIAEAVRLGCQMVEVDLRLTKDCRLVIHHDHCLERTTNGSGLVEEHSYASLRQLDAGSWFHPQYRTLQIPSLEEVLSLACANRVMVNIELKRECWEQELHPKGVESLLLAEIRRQKAERNVVVSSFLWDFIARLRRLAPDIRVALLPERANSHIDPCRLKEEYSCFSLHPHHAELEQGFVDLCQKAGVKVYPYTVDDPRSMKKCLQMGVDGIFTNHPDRLLPLLEQ